jgi:hypothetical protein
MDIRINELQSQVKTADSRSVLDPAMMRDIVRACVRAVKEELERDKRAAKERQLGSRNSSSDL